MKVGIIAPTRFLSKYCITDIQYCLPSLLVKNKMYRNFYTKRKEASNYIILDCKRVGWKREPEDFGIIEEALDVLDPDIMIAPSYMFNCKASEEIYGTFIDAFPKKVSKMIRCLEGASKEELTIEKGEFSVAVPSHMYRHALSLNLNSLTVYIENHLHLEELNGRKGTLVTSLPVRLGLQGRLLSNYLPSPESLTFDEVEDKYPKITKRNVEDTIDFYRTGG